MCMRPFTVFKWQPAKNSRYKTTDICTTCAKLKNICQVCILDLDLKIPLSLRNQAMQSVMTNSIKDTMPKEDVNREYFMRAVEKEMDKNGGNPALFSGKVGNMNREVLKRFAETETFKKRIKVQICPDFLKGHCTQGVNCRFRHEQPSEFEQETSDNISINAEVKSLLLLKVGEDITEEDIRTYFEVFGEVKSVVLMRKKNAAFVNFLERSAAENAQTSGKFGIRLKDQLVEVRWAKPKGLGPKTKPVIEVLKKEQEQQETISSSTSSHSVPLPPGAAKIIYPSQQK